VEESQAQSSAGQPDRQGRLFRDYLPSADFCRPVRTDRSILSLDSETNRRSPEVSSSAFGAQPLDLQPVPLIDMDFAVICPLVRRRMPQIRFLYIGSRFCSALLQTLPHSDAFAFHYHFLSIPL
jgi:hypothetical protein